MIVVHDYGSDILGVLGGHERFVRLLCDAISKHYGGDNDVKILVQHVGRDYRNCNVFYVGVPSIILARRFAVPIKLSRLVRFVRLGDVVHVHSPTNPFSFLALLIAKLIGKPIVCTVLCCLADVFHHRLLMRFLSPLTVFMETLAILLADVVHVENLRDYVLVWRVLGGRKRIVYVEPWLLSSTILSCQSRSASKGKRRGFLVLYLGRVDYAKGVHLLIEALKYLPSKVKLVVAGPVQDYVYLVRLRELVERFGLKDRVYFVGSVDEEFKHVLLCSCDVVVVPSISDIVEAYSIVATEAWLYQKPVVAFPVGALRYRVKNGVDGVIAERVCPKALARAILRALELGRVEKKVWSFVTVKIFLVLYRQLISRSANLGKG